MKSIMKIKVLSMGKKQKCLVCGKKINRNKKYRGLLACLYCELVFLHDDVPVTFEYYNENKYTKEFLKI